MFSNRIVNGTRWVWGFSSLIVLITGIATVALAQNWPSFRGPNASGVADGKPTPVNWDATKGTNILWKTPIPGLAHASPVIWGDKVFVTTAVSSKGGEYFLYGSETSADGSGVAWSAYRWRGEEKRKRDRVRGEDVVDVAAGIRVIRERQPQGSMRMRIWSDGKTYPVLVQRVGEANVSVPAGTFRADHYRVRGVRLTGERFWKGGMDLWLAQDEERTPVRIQVERGFANVRLDLVAED